MEDITLYTSHLNSRATIKIGGYKHVLVSLVSAAVACNCDVTFQNVPDIFDTQQIIQILRSIGKKVDYSESSLTLHSGCITCSDIPKQYSETIHGSIYLFIALVVANKRGSILNSGGCAIGNEKTKSSRPEHHFYEVMEHFGIKVEVASDGRRNGSYDKLAPAVIDIKDFKSNNGISSNLHSGATKAPILCATAVTDGTVEIKHPYLKPDVTELLEFLKLYGFNIQFSHDTIRISHSKSVSGNLTFQIMPDIAEIISFISFAVFNKVDLLLEFEQITKVQQGLRAEFSILSECKVPIEWTEKGLYIPGSIGIRPLPFSIIVTSSSIFSDSQPFFSIMALLSSGESSIKEGIWVSRFKYAEEAQKMGYPYEIQDNTLIIRPWTERRVQEHVDLVATDLRAAFVLMTLAVRYQDITIRDFYHIHRGYENIYEKMKSLGIGFTVSN